MITLKELNKDSLPTTPEIDKNLQTLLNAISRIRMAYNKPMIVTSGLRSKAKQEALIAQGKSNAPMSKHLIGAAVDISDPLGNLYNWCKVNEQVLIDTGLYCEERMGGWQHFQIFPPKSGHRWFFP